MDQTVYPIAEIFASIQGEGAYAGAPMTFIRLAGCSVGKPYSPEEKEASQLPIYAECCHTWAGDSFCCDTDFRVHARMTVDEICKTAEVQQAFRVCITGGEPLIHDLWPLTSRLTVLNKRIHLETSGTKTIPQLGARHWITVSPKVGFKYSALIVANEIKILVGPDFNEEQFAAMFPDHMHKIYLQPINKESEIDQDNIDRCVKLLDKYRQCRLSVQLHKILKVR